VKPSSKEEFGQCPVFACYTLAFASQPRKKAWKIISLRNDRSFAFHYVYALMAFKGTK
jgi:hypothetical protein